MGRSLGAGILGQDQYQAISDKSKQSEDFGSEGSKLKAQFSGHDLLSEKPTPVKSNSTDSWLPSISTTEAIVGGLAIGAGVLAWRHHAGAAARSALQMETLERGALSLKAELAAPIEFLRNNAGKESSAILAEGSAFFTSKARSGPDTFFKLPDAKGYLGLQKDGGILYRNGAKDPYTRFFPDGGFETGTKFVRDQGGFFINPSASLRRLGDGSSIYWERGPIGKLSFYPSQTAKSEPWAVNLAEVIEKARQPVARNLLSSLQGVNLNTALARELRSASPQEVFSLIPRGAQPIGAGREALVLKTDDAVFRISRSASERPAAVKDLVLPADSVTRGTGWQIEKMPYLSERVLDPRKINQLTRELKERGFYFIDKHNGNMRLLNGRAVVIDPGAVTNVRPLTLAEEFKIRFSQEGKVIKDSIKAMLGY